LRSGNSCASATVAGGQQLPVGNSVAVATVPFLQQLPLDNSYRGEIVDER
jgi:hypothetical protein